MFKKIKPFVGKINRIVKKSRLIAYIELEDSADVEKMMNVETPDHPLPKGKMEQLKTPISARLYNEDDVRVLNGIAKIVAKNPDMLKKNIQPPNKRPRMEFGGPGKISDTVWIFYFSFQNPSDNSSHILLSCNLIAGIDSPPFRSILLVPFLVFLFIHFSPRLLFQVWFNLNSTYNYFKVYNDLCILEKLTLATSAKVEFLPP